jgi:signal transduction histidine kinase
MNLLLGCFVLSQNHKKTSNQVFSVLALIAAIWTFANYMTGVSNSVFWLNCTYAFGAIVISVGLIWTIIITDGRTGKFKALVILGIGFFISASSFTNGFIAKEYGYFDNSNIYIAQYGWGLYIFSILYFICLLTILYKLRFSYKNNTNDYLKKQFLYIYSGALISLLITGMSSFILPYFSIYTFGGIDNIGFLIFLVSVAVSITKHQLFGIRLINIEIIAFIVWSILLARIVLLNSISSIIVEVLVFFVVIIFSVLLIRSVINETKQKNESMLLANIITNISLRLSDIVDLRTSQLQKSLESEQTARKDLEKLIETKNQFILMAQHNLRIPVYNIKYNFDTLSLNNNIAFNSTSKSLVYNIDNSILHLTRIVDDFYSIASLKSNSQILKISSCDIKKVISETLLELTNEIQKRQLLITFNGSDMPVNVEIDSYKIREVFQIVIENAVRYNRQNGKINIFLERNINDIKIIISNTGLGLTSDEEKALLSKTFYRGSMAKINNPKGMGIGLQIARAIINGHNGNIIISSDGRNRGAKVEIIIPVKFSSE